MLKKRFIILIAIAAIILPSVVIPLIALSLEVFTSILPKLPVSMAIDFSETMSSVEYIALYFSLLGVIATIILAYLIYRLEQSNKKRAEEEEISRVKRTLYVLLENGINRAIKSKNDDEWLTFDFIRVTDNHIGMIASIGHLLTEEQFLNLNQILETLKDIAVHEKNGNPYDAKMSVDRLMGLITIPFYPKYHFYMKNLKSIYDVMSKETLAIFNLLVADDNERSFTYGITYNSEEKKLFRNYQDNHFIVYDEFENIICDATFDERGMMTGKAKTFYEKDLLEYDGLFRDGKRSGWGIEYLFDERKGKEGEWEADQLINGVIYDVILDIEGKVFMDTIQQIESSSDPYDLERYASELKVGNVRVINGQMEVVKESIIKAADFIEVGEGGF